MTNPLYDPYAVLHAVYSGGTYLKQALTQTPIEECSRARTAKICYGVLENDIYLDFCIRAFAPKSPKLPVRILLKVALYMLLFMQKPRYMVTDNAVSLVKKLGKGGAAGFINAFLRAFDAEKLSLPKEREAYLSVRYSYPRFAVRRLLAAYGDEAEAIMQPQPARTFVRFAPGMAQKYGAEAAEPTPFADVYAFSSFRRDAGYDAGEYTFQSVGSVAICGVVSPCDTLLDACAAPGGKSVLLSEKCAQVTAFELHPHRAELIQSYCRRMHRENVHIVCRDSSVYDEKYEGAFSAVLCDVPCSGTGVINENPDIKLFRREEDIASLAKVQQKILANCARYVKPGGRLYYSTCSVLPEENDSAAFGFIRDNPLFELCIPDCALAARRTKFGLQFLPHISLGAGFFVTSFVRKS